MPKLDFAALRVLLDIAAEDEKRAVRASQVLRLQLRHLPVHTARACVNTRVRQSRM